MSEGSERARVTAPSSSPRLIARWKRGGRFFSQRISRRSSPPSTSSGLAKVKSSINFIGSNGKSKDGQGKGVGRSAWARAAGHGRAKEAAALAETVISRA